ncbi:MAG: HYR domain-containing protein, partial [Verrucomicrobia bacterium]|nr:HYR domain-containing protein [Verrucomicrobiota bacterium]
MALAPAQTLRALMTVSITPVASVEDVSADPTTSVGSRAGGQSATDQPTPAQVASQNVKAARAAEAALRISLPTVTTDKDDYQPGDIVTITGSGWWPHEIVEIFIVESTGRSHRWSTVADVLGGICDATFAITPEHLGVAFELTATGVASGAEARTHFTDNRTIDSVTLNGGSVVVVPPGATITVVITVTTDTLGGGGGAANDWRATSWRIATTPPGATTCNNFEPDHTTTDTFTETFTITAPLAPGTYNSYFIAYSNDGCSSNPSATFTLPNSVIVCSSVPTITSQPSAQTVCEGADTTFTVTATGSGLTYQWRKDGVNIADGPTGNGSTYGGVTTETLTITGTAAGDVGSYDVVVTASGGCSVTSNAAPLTVNTPPSITAQPVSQTVVSGSPVSFSVTATGAGLAYQWRKDGVNVITGGNISGATSSTLSITPAASSDAGSYDVVITGTCGPAATSAAAILTVTVVTDDPDLPGPPPNLEIIPAGSLIIPMDNTYQAVVSPFNLKAYGLVNAVLHAIIPVKWAIASGKAKDGIDFTANVQRILPTAQAPASLSFRSGPFIIHKNFASVALPVITAFGNNVAVYQLNADTAVDIRYTLTFRPRVLVANDGGTFGIHTSILEEAGFPTTHYDVFTDVSVLLAPGCYSIASSPHFEGDTKPGEPTADEKTSALRAFVLNGGNFLAQCAAVRTYENNALYGHFHTSLGIEDFRTGDPFSYLHPDLAFSQFQGELRNEGGSLREWKLETGSTFINSAHEHVENVANPNSIRAEVAKLFPGGPGSVVFYLGGHDYAGGALDQVNGRRMYLNAVFVPPHRPPVPICDIHFPGDGAPGLSIDDVTVSEGNAGTVNAVFTVTLSPASSYTVTVDYATADGTATLADSDYVAAADTLTFAPGETSKTITVVVNGDTKFEPDETFFVNLSNAVNAFITDSQGLGTITNDDPQPTISISDVNLPEGNVGTTPFTFTVSLSNPSFETITVNYVTAEGTATVADTDFLGASGTLTFAPGETTQLVTVLVNGDIKFEPNETFFVNLSGAVNATIANSQGQAAILNDDAVPAVTISDHSVTEGNAGAVAATFAVNLSNPSSQTITVAFTTADGTATAADNDYQSLGGTLTFNPDETTARVTVLINGDTKFEPGEIFFVNLSDAVNATLLDAQGQGTIVNDDGQPTITISDAFVTEGNAGTANMVFTVSLSNPSFQTVTVGFATADGTATLADNDYESASGTVTFAPGLTTQTITVLVNGDGVFEADETFVVNLAGAVNATIVDAQGLGTILNDECPPPSAVVSGDQTICAGDSATIQATLTGAAPWTLFWSDGFVQAGIPTSPATRSVSPAVTTTYTVTAVSDAFPCSGSGSGSALITVNPIPDCSISGDDPVCPNSSGLIYSVSSSLPGSTFSWAISGNGVIVGSSSGPSVTVDAGAAGSFTLTVTVSNTGCTGSCEMTVTVADTTPPIALCKSITVPLDASGVATITPADVDNGSSDDCGPVTLDVNPSTFTCANVGDTTVTLTVTDQSENASTCQATVSVVDLIPPVAQCANLTVQLDATGTASITAADVNAGSSDACGLQNLSVTPNTFTCADLGPNPVTLTVTDNNGNVSTCTAIVTVEDSIAPTIACPPSVVVNTDPNQCYATGVALGTPTTDDNCAVASVTNDAPLEFPQGATVVTWTVTDTSGNTAQCTQTILVNDAQSPQITCPSSLILSTDPGACTAVVIYAAPTGTDNCPGETTIQTAGLPSGSTFPVGTTVNTFLVTDAAGNTASCSFTVTVNDTEPPLITCPADISQPNTPGACDAVINYTAPVGTDNCPGATTVQIAGLPSGATFPVGSTLNTFVVTDTAGNIANCSFTVTVNDTQPPVLSVPADVTIGCTASTDPTSTGLATATDNCDAEAFLEWQSVWINEFHYDNTGGDVNEFVEVAGPAGVDLSRFEIVLYNGSGGAPYSTNQLSGVIDDEGCGFGAVAFPIAPIQNGPPDALALIYGRGQRVVEFLSYEGTFTAVGGPANGLTSVDVGVFESDPGTAAGFSLQLQGSGNRAADFSWAGPFDDSPGALNATQTISPCGGVMVISYLDRVVPGSCLKESIITRTWQAVDSAGNSTTGDQTITITDTEPPVLTLPPALTIDCDESTDPTNTGSATATDNCDGALVLGRLWINEIHYDNGGSDTNEFVEIAGLAGTVLNGSELVLYNGANGKPYGSLALSGVIPDEGCGFGAVMFWGTNFTFTSGSNIQNGSPDGIALVAGPNHEVLQFLSYEGVFTAVGGPADGLMSQDIGVSETDPGTPAGFSLQLRGAGNKYADFAWAAPSPSSPGSLNSGQTISPCGASTSILFSDTVTPGACPETYTITRTWTATDVCSNQSTGVQVITVQDTTPPVLTLCPANVTVECTADTTPAALGTATATDNCDSTPTITFSDASTQTSTGACTDQNYTLTRTWRATDNCGNFSECVQTITVQD